MVIIIRILLFTFLLFHISKTSASDIDFNNRPNVLYLNNMKIELLVPKTIRVERDTDNILNDGNFILNGIDYESPGLVVILTALNQDIKIQKDLARTIYRLPRN